MLYDPRYQLLRKALVDARLAAGVTQVVLAEKLQRAQSYVSKIESGGGYVDILDFLSWCEATRADPCLILNQLQASSPVTRWPKVPGTE